MKKTMSRLLAALLVGSLLLSGCSGTTSSETVDDSSADAGTEESTEESSENEIKDLVIPKLATRELETFNVLYSQRAEDGENLTNLVDGLLEVDSYGKLAPCIAEDWGIDDGGLTWTFHLRKGVNG